MTRPVFHVNGTKPPDQATLKLAAKIEKNIVAIKRSEASKRGWRVRKKMAAAREANP